MSSWQLKGLTWDDPRGYGPLRVVEQAFCAAHPSDGFAIDWDIQPLSGFESRSLPELAEVYDLVVADHPHVLEGARQECLIPVDGVEDEYVGPSYESYEWAGRCWAAPIDAACHVAAYRPDALTVEGEAGLPLTWADVERRARSGLRVAIPLAGVHSTMALVSLIASQPGHAERDVVELSSVAVKDALEQLRWLAGFLLPEGLQWNPLQALEALANDRVDYVPLTFGYAHYEIRGIRFAPVPRLEPDLPGRGVVGGAGMAVSAGSRHRDVAKAFARFCCQESTQRDWWPNFGGQPAHREAWDQMAQRHTFYRDTREAMASAVLRPRHSGFQEQQIALGESIQHWLESPAGTLPPPFPPLEHWQCAAAL